MSFVLGTVSQIMTRCLSIDILKEKSWNSFTELPEESNLQLCFWGDSLQSLNVRILVTGHVCTRVVYSDASSTGLAGYELRHTLG